MKRTLLTAVATIVTSTAAFAGNPTVVVPEAGVTGSLAALAAVAAVGAIAWERRRRSNKPD